MVIFTQPQQFEPNKMPEAFLILRIIWESVQAVWGGLVLVDLLPVCPFRTLRAGRLTLCIYVRCVTWTVTGGGLENWSHPRSLQSSDWDAKGLRQEVEKDVVRRGSMSVSRVQTLSSWLSRPLLWKSQWVFCSGLWCLPAGGWGSGCEWNLWRQTRVGEGVSILLHVNVVSLVLQQI